MSQIKLDGESFFAKVSNIRKQLSKSEDIDSVLLVMGKVSEDALRPQTSDFFLWLLNYEFADTILAISANQIVFVLSPKKAKIIKAMKLQTGQTGPEIQLIEYDAKTEQLSEVIDKFVKMGCLTKNVGCFVKDKIDGQFTKLCHEAMSENNLVDMTQLLQRAQQIKTEGEMKNLKVASAFTAWNFQRIIDEVEDIIDQEKQVKHSKIQRTIESVLEDQNIMQPFLKQQKDTPIDTEFLDFPLPVLVQSGTALNVHKFQNPSSQDILRSQAVYINVCSKYTDVCAMASRTILVNPKKEQIEAYKAAVDALEAIRQHLVVGQPISNAYEAASKLLTEKNADLHQHSNFGFGIGYNFREDQLMINATNETKVQPGMLFHGRIALTGVHPEPNRSVVAVGDTFKIAPNGDVVEMTDSIQKKYSEISYVLEEEAKEEEVQKPQTNGKKKVNGAKQSEGSSSSGEDSGSQSYDDDQLDEDDKQVIEAGDNANIYARGRKLRSKVQEQQNRKDEAETRKEHQKVLNEEMVKDAMDKYKKGHIKFANKKEKVKEMDKYEAYRSANEFPADLRPGQVFVDMQKHCVLIPNSPTTFIPFHVSTIKSVSEMSQGQWTFLRINFHTQQNGGNALKFPDTDSADPTNLSINQLTLKTQGTGQNNRLSKAQKDIKELQRQAKALEAASEVKQANQDGQQLEELVTLPRSQRRDVLDGLVIRPNLLGKKTLGNLEIHSNGCRFVTTKNNKVDVCFSNVKHCFFQPCSAEEIIVVIHFTLKQPILIGNKKVGDVQFFKESGVAAEDINVRGSRHRMNDIDELEQEERERAHKKRLNQKFIQFSKALENAAEKSGTYMEVDIPVENLAFYGCATKAVVKIRPTKHCLVAISEFPFFVLPFNDIQAVHFERIIYGIKNFDMAIIDKDYTTVKRISSIPIEYQDQLKVFFDEINVIYSEGPVTLNWGNVMTEIRNNFSDWLEDGGWEFLIKDFASDSGAEDPEDEIENSDPSAAYDDEEDSEEEMASDFSSYDEEDADESEKQSLSEEGQSWDELERQAEEEDRKMSARRAVAPTDNKDSERRRPDKKGHKHGSRHTEHRSKTRR